MFGGLFLLGGSVPHYMPCEKARECSKLLKYIGVWEQNPLKEVIIARNTAMYTSLHFNSYSVPMFIEYLGSLFWVYESYVRYCKVTWKHKCIHNSQQSKMEHLSVIVLSIFFVSYLLNIMIMIVL